MEAMRVPAGAAPGSNLAPVWFSTCRLLSITIWGRAPGFSRLLPQPISFSSSAAAGAAANIMAAATVLDRYFIFLLPSRPFTGGLGCIQANPADGQHDPSLSFWPHEHDSGEH